MRLIDADALFDFLTDQLEEEVGFYSKGRNAGLNIARSALHDTTSTPTIVPLPNAPLTLEELREMDGEPVWVEIPEDRVTEWCIAKWDPLMGRTRLWGSGGGWFDGRNCGKSVFIYRRRPEGGTT